MKRLLVIIIVVLSVILTGCMKEYPLTDAQTDIVAEYMAGRLLENDKKYSPSLISYKEILDYENIPSEEEPKPTQIPELDVDEDNNDINNTDEDSSMDTSDDINYTLSEVVGDPSFDIQYTGYMLAYTYPDSESSLVFSLDARKGYQLLIANFSIENLTDSNRDIDLMNAQIQYHLDINVGTVYKPLLALLENDMQYIDVNVKAGEKIPAVLIFEVSKDIDISDINLIISRDNKSEIIDIK